MADSYRFHPKKVRCIETGEIFKSVYSAAKTLEGDVLQNQINIGQCCKGQRYICRGYHWEYIGEEE